MCKKPFFFICIVCCTSVSALAVEYQRHTWDVGLSLKRYQLEDNKNSLIGNSAMFQVGRGWIGDRWRFNASVDILMGPYNEIRDERVKTDFFGTGLTATSYYSLNNNLRDTRGSWGISAGVAYSDIVGRSVENGTPDSDGKVITNLTMRATNFMVTAGLFHAWIKPARPEGNLPDLLLTRVEGFMIGLSGAYPVQSSYSTNYFTRTQGEKGPTGPPTSKKERGSLKGYSILASFTAMLGY